MSLFQQNAVSKAVLTAVCSPNENEDPRQYRTSVVEPFRHIQQVQNQLLEEKREPRSDEMRMVTEALYRILVAKKMSHLEIEACMAEVQGNRGAAQ